MKKIFIILFSLALIQRSFAQDSTTKKLDELLQAYHDAGKFNGSALVAQHGKILLQKGYGFKNIKTGTLNDENTIYQIASITKQFTATVEQTFRGEPELVLGSTTTSPIVRRT